MRRTDKRASGLMGRTLAGLMVLPPAALLAGLAPLPVQAQEAATGFAIPAGPLNEALAAFGRQSGLQVTYGPALAAGKRSPGFTGQASASEALRGLLQGTGLGHRFINPRTVTLAAQAEPGALLLPDVNVAAGLQRGWSPVPGFVAEVSGAATKTDTPLIETPQSISVIPRQQIDAQQAQSVGQALRYTAGVTGEQRGAYGTGFDFGKARGFTLDYYLDGMRIPTDNGPTAPQIDGFLLERVEVLRGPSSVLYGQGNPGGVVNLVSRRPGETVSGEARLQIGSYGRVASGFDSTGPLNAEGTLLYRITGSAAHSGSQVEDTRYQRIAVAPAVTWKPDAATSWTLLGNYQNDPYGGYMNYLPAIGTFLANPNGQLDTGRNYGNPESFKNSRLAYSLTSLFEHRFDETWTFRQNARYGHRRASYDGAYILGFAADRRSLTGAYLSGSTHDDTFLVDNQAEARFSTGPLHHTLLAGFDYQHSQTQTIAYSAAITPFDPFAADYRVPNSPAYRAPNSSSSQSLSRYGLYLQDQIAWGRWRLLLGGRQDWVGTDTRNRLTGTTADKDDQAFTGRAGLVYLFDMGLAPYVSYAESFSPTSGTGRQGNAFRPTRGVQYEAGVKYQPPGSGLLLTAAVYQLTQQNVLTTDPVNPSFSVQTGEVRSRGIELEARASRGRHLNLVAGYAYTDAEVTKANNATQGKAPIETPRHSATLWADWRFDEGTLAGFRLGGGLRYLGSTWADAQNTGRTPSATLVDAAISYELGTLAPQLQGMRLAVNATNLTDKEYVQGCFALTGCYIGLRRTVLGTLSYSW
ncbi:TonB-dependent siderophore receptor [Roseomonas sp. USHLN139]|uniref:TonB-dependent siderophore receptor n=1 Tax=Roseomonas sp. USHLN139 TaxID=3081298 RepID=UPI003B010E53